MNFIVKLDKFNIYVLSLLAIYLFIPYNSILKIIFLFHYVKLEVNFRVLFQTRTNVLWLFLFCLTSIQDWTWAEILKILNILVKRITRKGTSR